MGSTRYEGWANYATWGIALIVDNNRETHDAVMAAYHDGEPMENGEDDPSWIREYVERLAGCEDDYADDPATSMVRQLVQAALSDVDWMEIHEHYLSLSRD